MFDVGTQLRIKEIDSIVTVYGIGIDVDTSNVSRLKDIDTVMFSNEDYNFLVVYDEGGKSYESVVRYSDIIEVVEEQCYGKPKFELLDIVKNGKTEGMVVFVEYYEEEFNYTLLNEDEYGGFYKAIDFESKLKY